MLSHTGKLNLGIQMLASLVALLLVGSALSARRKPEGPSKVDLLSNQQKPIASHQSESSLAGHRILNRFDHAVDSTQKLKIPLLGISCLLEDQGGDLWAAGMMGVYRYHQSRNDWTSFSQTDESLKWVQVICQDKAGRVWILSGKEPRLRFLDGTSWRDAAEVDERGSLRGVRLLFKGRTGKLWALAGRRLLCNSASAWSQLVAIPDDTLRRYTTMRRRSGEDHTSHALSLLDELTSARQGKPGEVEFLFTKEVAHGLEDRDNCIWLGAARAILQIDLTYHEYRIHALPAALLDVEHMYEDRTGRIWCGDTYGHVAVYDKRIGKWTSYDIAPVFLQFKLRPVDPNLFVHAIFQDKGYQMLFGTDRGLVAFEESRNRWRIYNTQTGDLTSDRITAIVEDRGERVLVGTGRGVLLLAP